MGTGESSISNLDDDTNVKNQNNQPPNIIDTNYIESECEDDEFNQAFNVENQSNLFIFENDPTNNKLMRFHDVCGKNIIMSPNRQQVKRAENSFCNAIAFSNRPIGVYERIYIKIIKLSTLWNGMLRFGITIVDPNSHRKKTSLNLPVRDTNYSIDDQTNDDECAFNLPKYVYPDFTNQKGYWAGALTQSSIKENDVIYFYVNSSGEVHYGINNLHKGLFIEGIEVYKRPHEAHPLWAIFDIYGNTLSIEILNKQPDINNNNSNLLANQLVQRNQFLRPNDSLETVSSISNNFRTLSISETNTNSFGSTSDPSLASSSNSYQSSLSSTSTTSSNIITIIPNRHVIMRQNRNEIRNETNRKSKTDNLDMLLISHRRLCVDNHLNETLRTSIVETPSNCKIYKSNLRKNESDYELNEQIKFFYESIPILLHEKTTCKFLNKIHGLNVNICEPDCSIAYRESSILQLKDRHINKYVRKEPTRNSYVFLDKPVEKGKSFCIQIVGIDQSPNESKMSLGIGCTTCDPKKLNPLIDLPDDADCLLDRPEYWVVYQNLFNSDFVIKKHQVALADELCFFIDEASGDLNFYINGNLITKCLFSVDPTQNLWFFFDLCGKINAIRLIKSCLQKNDFQLRIQSDNRTNSNQRSRPNSALIDYYKSQLLTESEQNNLNKNADLSKKEKKNSWSQEECRICLDAPIECVFYSCGHMCVCWRCATTLKKETIKCSQTENKEQKKSKKPTCPICRVEIIDIIRFFKS